MHSVFDPLLQKEAASCVGQQRRVQVEISLCYCLIFYDAVGGHRLSFRVKGRECKAEITPEKIKRF